MTVHQTRASSRSKSERPRVSAAAQGEETRLRAPPSFTASVRERLAPVLGGEAPIDAEAREEMIRRGAYFRAERRRFEPGHELEDWLAAEREFDRWLSTRAAPRRYGR